MIYLSDMDIIIKQSSHKYCIFNTCVDTITFADLEYREVYGLLMKEAKERVKRKLDNSLKRIENEKEGDEWTFKEVMDHIKSVRGEEEYKRVLKALKEC